MIRAAALLFSFSLYCHCPAQAVTAYADAFRATLQSGEQVDAYVIKPFRTMHAAASTPWQALANHWQARGNGKLAQQILHNAARFIDEKSKSLGHVNAATRQAHEREIRLLQQGYWPTVVVTKADNPAEVLLTVSIAIPWHSEPVPFKMRFFGKGVDGLPSSYGSVSIGINNFFEDNGYMHPVTAFGEEGFRIVPDLSVITSMLPWANGDEAEIKFLMQRDGSDANLSSLAHALIVAHGMHRFTGVLLPRWMIRQQVDFMSDPVVRREFETRIAQAQQARQKEWAGTADEQRSQLFSDLYFQALRQTVFSPMGFQRTTAISTLFAHVSEKASAPQTLTRMFIRKFRFPNTPVYDFLENKQIGTEGIRTRIFSLNLENFDLDMMEGLNPKTLELADGFQLRRLHLNTRPCSVLLTDFDTQILSRAHKLYRKAR